jgi:hypothetical protein
MLKNRRILSFSPRPFYLGVKNKNMCFYQNSKPGCPASYSIALERHVANEIKYINERPSIQHEAVFGKCFALLLLFTYVLAHILVPYFGHMKSNLELWGSSTGENNCLRL